MEPLANLFSLESRIRTLTDNRLSGVFVGEECTLAISNEERQIEEVLDGLPKVMRVDNEPEDVHGALDIVQQTLELWSGYVRIPA